MKEETVIKEPEETWDQLIRRLYPNKSDAWYDAKKSKVYNDMIRNTRTRNQRYKV